MIDRSAIDARSAWANLRSAVITHYGNHTPEVVRLDQLGRRLFVEGTAPSTPPTPSTREVHWR